MTTKDSFWRFYLFIILTLQRLVDAPNALAASCADPDDLQLQCLEDIINNLLTKVVVLVGISSFLMLIYGGLRYITAGGDQKTVDGARKTVTYSLLGFGLTVSIYFIFKVLLNALGLGWFLQFTIPPKTP